MNEISEARFKNQSALLSIEATKSPVYIIGAGSVGSFVALTLAKMGYRDITVQDMDTVEEHNIANQFYPVDSIGRSKVDALFDLLLVMAGTEIKVDGSPWTIETRLPKGVAVLVVAVDDMDLRAAIYAQWGDKVPYLVEARMGAEVARIYGVNLLNDVERAFYASTLYPQAQATPDRCAAKSIIYTVLGIASFMSSIVKRMTMGQGFPTEVVYDFVTHTHTMFKAKELAIPKEVEAATALSV